MMSIRDKKNKGQALIMITFSLVAMCGIMGLAVDLGWGYFVKKSAQRAADSAAMAAVERALDDVGQVTKFTCGVSNLSCVSMSQCAAAPNTTAPLNEYDTACLYAKQNGFIRDSGSNNTKQNVIIDSNTTNPVPTAPGITVDYWVTVRATQVIPQLFSSIFGFYTGQSSARATAAILDSPVSGSLYMLARENDKNSAPPPKAPTGTSLSMQGTVSITATGGAYLASAGNCTGGPCSGQMGGNASLTAGLVGVRGTGVISGNGGYSVNPTPTTGMLDPAGGPFRDPMAGKYQPPPPTAADAPDTPVPGGSIGGGKSCTTVNPGTYYATDPKTGKATGGQISFSGCVNFSAPTGFGNYVFFGGVNFSSPGTVVTMAPGRYIYAGVRGTENTTFNMTNGVTIQDQTPLSGGNMVQNTDSGELFVFTDQNYTGGDPASGTQRSVYVPSALSGLKFQYGDVQLQTGTDAASMLDLHGLNPTAGATPDELKTYAPTVFWTDQGNSPILYDEKGNIVDSTSCGGGGTLATPCANTNSTVTMTGKDPSTLFDMQASPNMHLYGVLYQPRGDTFDFQGSGTMTTPMAIITGTLVMTGGGAILQPIPNNPFIRRMVALVE